MIKLDYCLFITTFITFTNTQKRDTPIQNDPGFEIYSAYDHIDFLGGLGIRFIDGCQGNFLNNND